MTLVWGFVMQMNGKFAISGNQFSSSTEIIKAIRVTPDFRQRSKSLDRHMVPQVKTLILPFPTVSSMTFPVHLFILRIIKAFR